MAFTKEQQEAIEYRDKNLLVAAAAGSGKTSVLVERIIRRILVDNIDVDKLLIVTFTKAAAGEMRERIYSSIQAKLQENINTTRLLEQQALLSKSYITTIDSFCQNVIRSNFIESGIDSSYRVADESEMLLIKEEVIDEVLEKWYEKKDPFFYNLVETYGSSKTDENLKKIILDIHSFVQSFPWPASWLNEQRSRLNPKKYKDFGETQWGRDALSYLTVTLEGILNEAKRIKALAKENNITGYYNTFESDENMIREIYEKSKDATWNDAFDLLNSVSFERLARVKTGEDKDYAEKLKSLRDKIKKSLSGLVLDIFGGYKEAAMEDMELMYKDIRKLIHLVKYFSYRLQEEKKERKILDFPDMEHMALNVLAKRKGHEIIPTEVALKYRSQFEEIYIDEYQDTNLTQETILNVIARDNNKFHVGDVKQSIYSFRQARPDLFINKYNDYAVNTEKNKLIKLYKNFRSRRDIVGSVNYIFSRLMNEMTAEMNYTEDEYLNYGAEYYNDDFNSHCELLIAAESDKGIKASAETEALLIANRIKRLFKEEHKVFDTRTSSMRNIQLRDIVILMRSVSSKADIYRQIFAREGIPLFYEGRGGFFACLEISVVLAFLRIIDNPLQDIPLITVLRSPMFSFSDAELALTRLAGKDMLFYDALLEYEKQGNSDSLKEKIKGFRVLLEKYREFGTIYTTAELIWEIITETGYYTYVGLCEEGEKKQANLRLLFEKAANYDSGSNKGIFRFINYIENLKRKEGDMAEAMAISEGMNVVRIMTIHRSKGLEFPVVFLSNTAQDFSNNDITGRLVKHKTLGLGPSCFDKERKIIYPSVIKKIISRRIIADTKAEEMRILYVGLTRAREKLIVTGCIKEDAATYLDNMSLLCDYDTHLPLNYSIIESANMLDWISMALSYHHINGMTDPKTKCDWDIEFFTAEDIENGKLPDIIEAQSEPEDIRQEEDSETDQKIRSVLEWSYPYKELSSVPSKLSVSDVKRYGEEIFEDEYSLNNRETTFNGLPDFMDTKVSDISAALKGTLIHACIQQINFKSLKGVTDRAAVKEYVKILIDNMVRSGFITELHAKAIEQSIIVNFILSPFAERMMNADKLFREVPFTIVKEWGTIYDSDDHGNETVAIQGIIDCYFEENGRITVVDFKSDYVGSRSDEQAIAEKYRTQVNLYREALEIITGKEVNEAYIYLLRSGSVVKI